MIYVGENAAPLYRGDYRPAALYRGENKITGWADVSKTAPCAWENTYNDAVTLDVLGTVCTKNSSGKNLYKIDNDSTVSYPNGAAVPADRWAIGDNTYLIDIPAYLSEVDLHNDFTTFTEGKSYTLSFEAKMAEQPPAPLRINVILKSGGVKQFSWSPYLDQADEYQRFSRTFQATASGPAILSLQALGSAADSSPVLAQFQRIQLEEGDSATEYEPFVVMKLLFPAQAELVSSDRAGASTSSLELPVLRQILGTTVRDELHGRTLTRRVGVVDSYSGEDVGDVWCSTTGQLTTGATVWYQLKMPVTETVSGVLKTYPGYTELTVSGDYPPEITATARVVD